MGRQGTLGTGAGKSRATGTWQYFRWATGLTILALMLGTWIGWAMTGTVSGGFSALFICVVLAVLEISLSFDNAIVNANKLKDMQPVWRKRFLTWGILVAVFGMRLIFPLLVVALAAGVGPLRALHLAISSPTAYEQIMHHAHLPIAAFGGTFLLMVSLRFFFDHEKHVHWIKWLESPMSKLAHLRSIEIAVLLLVLLLFSRLQPDPMRIEFLEAALWGLAAFLGVELLGAAIDSGLGTEGTAKNVATGGFGAFLYLEMLDASFSFDGVVGAFALSNNLFIIAIGLGIGALYVRSMTVMMFERQTLTEYRYLEHGAFYAVFALSLIMFAQTLVEIPEAITGLGGAALIGLSFWSSLKCRRAE